MNPPLGIALKIVSALFFTLMSAGIGRVSAEVPVGEIVFFRSAFALVPLVVWLTWQGDLGRSIRTSHLGGHLLRGIMGGTSMFCTFLALSFLPLSEAIAIGYAAPLITVVLAALLLKETVRIYRWSAVVIGFVGVLVMLLPHLRAGLSGATTEGGSGIGAAIALVGAACTSGAMIQTRRLTATEKTGAIVLYFSLLTAALGLATSALGGFVPQARWVVPPFGTLATLILIGVVGGIGQILLTESYRHGDASLIAPFEYTTMIWALLIGWFAFGQLPGSTVLIGGAIVVGSGIFVLWREHRLGLVRAKALEAGSQRPT